MTISTAFYENLASRQALIQAKCFHPEGGFVPFERSEIEQSIAARFESQVVNYPDHLAIRDWGTTLTYAQLNQAANRVAHAILDQLGEGEETVALYLGHNYKMIVAIMGVLKAGKIYVALDRAFPPERLTYILGDSGANLILTDDANRAAVETLAGDEQPVLNLDQLPASLPQTNPNLSIAPDRIAYIIYTSGSTGKPKGVYQNQRNLLHNIMQYTNTLHLGHYDRLSLLYSCSVNGSLRDIFGALLIGASVHPYNVKEDGLLSLAAWLVEQEITFYHSVPTLFRHFIEALPDGVQFPNIRLIRFGGERVPRKNVDFYKKIFPDHCLMYTGMGSTETSTIRQLFIDKETVMEASVVPTGFAVAERDVLLLDEAGQDVGLNEVGQIVVRSPYLAVGYWNRADLTAEKIKPDPNGGEARLYFMGDLAQIYSSGCLVHYGRQDFQVKVSGYRIEVAEIEMSLLEHEAVQEAAVLMREDPRGEQRLVAYVVPRRNHTVTTGELKGFLKTRVPDYMQPAVFVILEKMPLTDNGKINRLALPDPEQVRPDLDNPFVPPRNDSEQAMVNIWEEVLGLHPIGVTDNFFDLGGSSLLAMRLVSKIETITGLHVTPTILFQAPSVAQLVETLQQQNVKMSPSVLIPLKPEGIKPPIFLLPGNMGNVFTDLKELVRHIDADCPVYAFQDGIHNENRVEDVARKYLAELKTIQPEGPYALCGICWGGPIAYEMAQQLRAQGEAMTMLALVEPSRPWRGHLWPHLHFAATTLYRLSRRLWHHTHQSAQLQTNDRQTYTKMKLKVLTNQWSTRRYRPKPYPDPLTLIMGQESVEADGHNPRLDWQQWATAVDLRYIPGNHDTITGNNNTPIEERGMQALADILKKRLTPLPRLSPLEIRNFQSAIAE